MKNKRGISPLIATVLLIGFTIVLAALIMQWGSSLLKEQTETTGTTSKAQIACSTEVDFTVDSVIIDSSDATGKTIKVTITNNRDRPLVDFITRVKHTAGGTTDVDQSVSDLPGGLGAFESKIYSATTTSANAAGDTVDVIPKIDVDGSQVPCSEQVKTKTI
ncbi:MAG: archaellin/type IV pilin N-terminal domain-containing protein [Nanoarchaeota archaeon]